MYESVPLAGVVFGTENNIKNLVITNKASFIGHVFHKQAENSFLVSNV